MYIHWHRGKTEKDQSPEYYKIFRKNTIFNEHPVYKSRYQTFFPIQISHLLPGRSICDAKCIKKNKYPICINVTPKKIKVISRYNAFSNKTTKLQGIFFSFCNIQLNSIWNSNCKGHAIKARTWAEEIFEVLFYLKCKYIKGRIQASVSANWNGLVRWCWYWMVKYYLWWYQKISVGISSNIEHTIFKHERQYRISNTGYLKKSLRS